MSEFQVALVGASGYSGEELIRLLGGHPRVRLSCITSRQHVGKALADVQPAFRGHPRVGDLVFGPATAAAVVDSGAEVAFLALPHGLGAEFAVPLLAAGLRIIDLSADLRIKDTALYREFYGADHPAPELLAESVYGLPERRRDAIRDARLVASPGCYPTSILLPLLPLLDARVISPEGIVANSASGVSGAGRKAEVTLLFAECAGSVRAYGLPHHRHLPEIEQELSLAAKTDVKIAFHPHLVPIGRGIHSTITARPKPGVGEADLTRVLQEAYGKEPFVRLLGPGGFPDTKRVARSNFLDLAWHFDPRTGTVVLLSAEDNLVKGAGGQAIQSMNLMLGCPETEGLLP